MTDWEKMYKILFTAITDAKEILHKAQQTTIDMFMSEGRHDGAENDDAVKPGD